MNMAASNIMPISPAPLVEIRDLVVSYPTRGGTLRAVSGVSLDIRQGGTLGLIGESGSGKSTIARAICGLGPVESGSIRIGGQEVATQHNRAALAGTLGVQIVFQDPTSALNPRWPLWRSVAEPRLRGQPASRAAHRAHAIELLRRVGLGERFADRRPSQVSGGQRQRVTIARALTSQPRLIILDEAVSALDVSIRNEILALLEDLKRENDLTYLFISHDVGAVIQVATEVAVLYLGRLVESGSVAEVIGRPRHPYTRALVDAVPTLRAARSVGQPAKGDIGNPANPPSGCRFHPRCHYAVADCQVKEPELRSDNGRLVACHRIEEIASLVDA